MSYSIEECAENIAASVYDIRSMEGLRNRNNAGAEFIHFLNYSRLLGISMRDLFNLALSEYYLIEDRIEGSIFDSKNIYLQLREERLLIATQDAIRQLHEQGENATHKSVANLLHISSRMILYYPRVAELLRQNRNRGSRPSQLRQRELREDVLIGKVQDAINYLQSTDVLVSQKKVGEYLQLSIAGLRAYPRIRIILEQLVARRPRQTKHGLSTAKAKTVLREEVLVEETSKLFVREDEYIAAVHRAAQQLHTNGQAVTQQAIAQIMGVSRPTLRRYPKVNALLREIAQNQLYGPARFSYVREDELFQAAQTAIAELRALSQAITLRNIAKQLQMSPSGLNRYPRVSQLVREHRQLRNQTRLRHRQAREDELVERVSSAIILLREQGLPISQRAISEQVQVPCTSLRQYSSVYAILKSIKGETFTEARQISDTSREDELVVAVKAAVQSLLASGQSLSQRAIAKVVGVSVAGLRYYPRVAELFRQVNEVRMQELEQKREKYERELVEQVLAAVALLREREQSITQEAISKVVGKTPGALMRYPPVKAALLASIQ